MSSGGGGGPPPRGKKAHQPSPATIARQGKESFELDEDDMVSGLQDAHNGGGVASGSGFNAAKSRGDAYDDDVERSMSLSPSRRHLLMESPETTIGPAVHMKGELSFGKLLRIDGTFSGKLVSTGDLIVGESGVLHGNIENMGEVMVDGKVVGNITVERVELRGRAEVHGNITCKSLSIDSSVIVIGNLNVHPGAPAKLSPGSEFDHPEKTVPVEEGSKSSHDKARDKPEKTKRRSSTSSKHEQEKDKEESKGKENKHHKKKEDKEMSGGQEEEGAGGGGDALATEAPTATGE